MWSHNKKNAAGSGGPANDCRQQLLIARAGMVEALHLLDIHSLSAAAATLDMAIHQLDREMAAAPERDLP